MSSDECDVPGLDVSGSGLPEFRVRDFDSCPEDRVFLVDGPRVSEALDRGDPPPAGSAVAWDMGEV